MGGIGAAAGPLLGGLITSAISWRAAFVFQALVVLAIVVLSRRLEDPSPADPTRVPDTLGAVLSAVGLVLVVLGILAADDNGWLTRRARRRRCAGASSPSSSTSATASGTGKEPLLSTALFRNRTLEPRARHPERAVAAADGHVVRRVGVPAGRARLRRHPDRRHLHRRHRSASSRRRLAAERLAKRRPQRTLIAGGFVTTIVGVVVLLALVKGSPSAWAFAPGLLLIGLGLGIMLTPSVNIVQSAFPEAQQGEISGLSRSISNLGSTLGTAIAGTILVAGLTADPKQAYALAMIVLAVVGVVGLGVTMLLPRQPAAQPVPNPLLGPAVN